MEQRSSSNISSIGRLSDLLRKGTGDPEVEFEALVGSPDLLNSVHILRHAVLASIARGWHFSNSDPRRLVGVSLRAGLAGRRSLHEFEKRGPRTMRERILYRSDIGRGCCERPTWHPSLRSDAGSLGRAFESTSDPPAPCVWSYHRARRWKTPDSTKRNSSSTSRAAQWRWQSRPRR
jgi:hypothetical protein